MGLHLDNHLVQLLFPAQTRDFKGKRWIKITLRTVHIIGIAGIAGSFLSDALTDRWPIYLHLTILSGIAMVLLDIWANGIWLLQMRGMVILLKIALFSLLFISNEYAGPIFITIITISALIAHAPSDVRYYSIFHRKRIGSLCKANK